MITVKSYKDAERFLDFVKESTRGVTFKDSTISMINGGVTRIAYDEEKEQYYHFSVGQNWVDQAPTYIEDPVKWVYKRRADINRRYDDWL